jgi:hypothetical protein
MFQPIRFGCIDCIPELTFNVGHVAVGGPGGGVIAVLPNIATL